MVSSTEGPGTSGMCWRSEDDLVQAFDGGELLDAGDSVFPVAAEGKAVYVLVRDSELVGDVGAGVAGGVVVGLQPGYQG